MASETSSINKSEAGAIVGDVSELVDPSVKVATTSQRKSKTKVKAVVAAVAATQELSEAEHASNLSVDHPYLSVLYKRIRSHRKKLEKIKGLEQAKASEGKRLNTQQLELMGNKATLEKLVAELEMLREQFVGVYNQEMEQKKQKEEKMAEGEAVIVEEKVQEKEESEVVAEQEERALETEQETQQLEKKVQEKEDFAHVYELLKTLHVVTLHQALGKEVPMVLDFFSKVLLGNTRPPAELSYEENLLESLEEAKKYLADSDKMFACDTTYSGLRVFVDQLANISSGKEEEKEAEVKVDEKVVSVEEPAVNEETSDVPVVPAEINTMPQISFFTESQLESELDDETTAKVEQVEMSESQVEFTDVVSDSVPTPPLSFAAVAAGVDIERTPSPSASSGSSGNDKKEDGSGGNSPRKNSRRRGQGRWREKSSNSNSGNKSSNGSPTNGGKPRRPRGPRTSDDSGVVQGGKRFGSKEGRHPRVDRGLRKQGNSTQGHATPMIAPHA
ncbi:Hypothetical protein PHPALM_37115 [Phytophthora palmivora]|uniref:Uncharacterized protein n=1 Tax=Phytophthora palmivora TaxID=4796 RepID=A0A2P4WY80_9STRA|nr:Hypothetical protein PHPALM_37115 [Phytophthora palmivora]